MNVEKVNAAKRAEQGRRTASTARATEVQEKLGCKIREASRWRLSRIAVGFNAPI